MKPVLINGDLWNIELVNPTSPNLIDRTGELKLATTDPITKTISISNKINPPLLDEVLLHEVAHAITISHGLLAPLRAQLPTDLWILVEEWSAQLMGQYSIEAGLLASQALGRPLCINGYCIISSQEVQH